MDRLQKIIAASGLTSRRKAEDWILQGRVKVDGQVVTELGVKPRKGALIEVDGKAIAREDKVYYVMNKPKKVLCTLNDEHDRRTVVDLMTDVPQRVFPVGRLDYDTTGVLIMTNDGEFANEIIHPRYHIAKVYEVTINGILKTEEIKQLEQGVVLDDGIKTLPAKLWVTNKDFAHEQTMFELTIQEGRNRQIKRMLEVFGYEVRRLHRRSLGPITVRGLNPGEYRLMKPFEVKQLRRLANEGRLK
ncbi:pseudouridine synthase [Holdemania filiformis]|uniref:pseudouridine synthase n=1 Tax=Holdemania filiformis TaxID=61171 RepID=UPI00242CA525|nr:pseudouridine synthase [Holdemania filiformis]